VAELFDTTCTISLSAAADMLAERRTGHRMAMQLWGDVESTVHRGARATVGCLWNVTASDLRTQTATLLVRSQHRPERRVPWATEQTTVETSIPARGAQVSFDVTIAAMYTPRSDVPEEWQIELKKGADGSARPPGQGLAYRNNQVPVPLDRLQTWAERKLDQIGIRGTVVAEPAAVARIKHGAKLSTARVRVTDVVTEDDLVAAVRNGIGKGRSYGLGLVVLDR